MLSFDVLFNNVLIHAYQMEALIDLQDYACLWFGTT